MGRFWCSAVGFFRFFSLVLVRGSFFEPFGVSGHPSGSQKSLKSLYCRTKTRVRRFAKNACRELLLASFWTTLAAFGTTLDAFWSILRLLGAPGGSLGLSRAPLGSPQGPHGRQKEHLRGVLRRSGRPGGRKERQRNLKDLKNTVPRLRNGSRIPEVSPPKSSPCDRQARRAFLVSTGALPNARPC